MLKSPFFPRMLDLCESMNWKNWAGYHAVASYRTLHDSEYFAFRTSAGLLDVTPLFKYRVTGPDASRFLAHMMVKDIRKLKTGRVAYLCWCTDEGKVVDDGTVMRRSEEEFFVTSADPCFSWFSKFLRGYNVTLEDITKEVAGLALQGPTSRDILNQITETNLDDLKFFRTVRTRINDIPVWISRTGYTGDLGYEIWVENKNALKLWDHITDAGRPFAIRPAGLNALDVCRIESGLILKNVDYYNALHVLIDDRKSSPFELSLGWTVDLDREPFNGQKSLRKEMNLGSRWTLVGLDIDWPEMEALYARHGLPPEINTLAWRKSIPVYSSPKRNKQVGYGTSGTWSPVLKKNIALATVLAKYQDPGQKVWIETTVEHIRYTVKAVVQKPQFFNPARKRSNPGKLKDVTVQSVL